MLHPSNDPSLLKDSHHLVVRLTFIETANAVTIQNIPEVRTRKDNYTTIIHTLIKNGF